MSKRLERVCVEPPRPKGATGGRPQESPTRACKYIGRPALREQFDCFLIKTAPQKGVPNLLLAPNLRKQASRGDEPVKGVRLNSHPAPMTSQEVFLSFQN